MYEFISGLDDHDDVEEDESSKDEEKVEEEGGPVEGTPWARAPAQRRFAEVQRLEGRPIGGGEAAARGRAYGWRGRARGSARFGRP